MAGCNVFEGAPLRQQVAASSQAPPAVPHPLTTRGSGTSMWREGLHDGARRVALGAGGQEGLFWWGSHDLMLKHTALALYSSTVVVAALLADASDESTIDRMRH